MSEEPNSLSSEELKSVTGGTDIHKKLALYSDHQTHVASGYLALRSANCPDPKNEIGQLWNGSVVSIQSEPQGGYVYVYVRICAKGDWGVDCTGKSGYVNYKYLV